MDSASLRLSKSHKVTSLAECHLHLSPGNKEAGKDIPRLLADIQGRTLRMVGRHSGCQNEQAIAKTN